MAKIFLDADEIFPLTAPAQVFGRSDGNEGIMLQGSASGVRIDANVERLDLADAAGALTFQVTADGLTILRGDEMVASFASLNQDLDLRLTDGNLSIRQTGATRFEVTGDAGATQTIETDPTAISVPLSSEPRPGDVPVDGSPDDSGGGNTLSGQVLVDGSPVTEIATDASTLTVGDDASGSATLTDGQTRTFTSDGLANVLIGAQASGDGALTLRGDGTDIVTAGINNTIEPGQTGMGTLRLEDGAGISALQLQIGRDGAGEAVLTGDGTTATLTPDNGRFEEQFAEIASIVRVGRNDGSSGKLDVLDGALLTVSNGATTDTTGPTFDIARNAGSTGDVVVDNATVRVVQDVPIIDTDAFGKAAPVVFVGRGGTGTMTIRNEGSVELSGDQTDVIVGRDAGSDGTLDVSGGGTIEALFYNVGFNEGSRGTVTVAGEGSRLTASGTAGSSSDEAGNAAFVTIGRGGTGTVTVRDGGRLEAVSTDGPTPGVTLGRESTGDGTLNVESGGQIDTLFIQVGENGTGNMTIDGAGTEVAMTGEFESGDATFLQLARNGEGTLTISNGGALTFDGGTASFPGFNVGRNEGGTGTLVVDGDGSRVTITGDNDSPGGGSGFIGIGRNGDGTATVTNGGEVTNDPDGTTFVGLTPTAVGELTVTGNGATFDAGASLLIGAGFDFNTGNVLPAQGGVGQVTVEDGATLTAGTPGDGIADIVVGPGDTLTLGAGGTLVGDVDLVGGSFNRDPDATFQGMEL